MELSFRKINEENYEQCIELDVHDNQRDFVAPNAYSLVQAQYIEGLFPYAIYDRETMVGFIMYEYDKEEDDLGMCRLMIGLEHQKKGYGRAAVLKLIDMLRKEFGHRPLLTSFEPENKVAFKLYTSVGFKETGELLEEEILLKLDM